MSTRVLVVDDDPQLRTSFSRLLEGEGYEVHMASDGEAGLARVRDAGSCPDVVVMDVQMPGMDGLAATTAMLQDAPGLAIVIMTAHSTTDIAIEATRRGAFDYVTKPFDIPAMLEVVGRAAAATRAREWQGADAAAKADAADREGASTVVSDAAAPDRMVGESPAMQELFKTIGRVAPTEATVLVRGESGTGKELVARALHRHSRRAEHPLVTINCVAIPETLLESELFGYERGAFTGASARRPGRIEQAAGGTVFLDEIGDVPPSIQAKLLRLLEEKTVERLGGTSRHVDVRIIAATNRNLEAAVAAGEFREDLFYRLNVVCIGLPPLRDRLADMAGLSRVLLARHAVQSGMDVRRVPGVSDEGVAWLCTQPWPGNVRELSNLLHTALIFGQGGAGGVLDARTLQAARMRMGHAPRDAGVTDGPPAGSADTELGEVLSGGKHPTPEELLQTLLQPHLGALLGQPSDVQPDDAAGPESAQDGVLVRLTDRLSALLIAEALRASGGNRSQAARLLGVSRPTLHARMDKYGLQ